MTLRKHNDTQKKAAVQEWKWYGYKPSDDIQLIFSRFQSSSFTEMIFKDFWGIDVSIVSMCVWFNVCLYLITDDRKKKKNKTYSSGK